VSSLFGKKPSRIEGLLMVMTLALLVYSVAQRRLRAQLVTHQETVPNQIHQPTTSPTLRWVFQLLEGIHRIRMTVQGQTHDLIEVIECPALSGYPFSSSVVKVSPSAKVLA